MVAEKDGREKALRIAAARRALAETYATNPDAVQRFEARKAKIDAARKRERERFELLVLGQSRPVEKVVRKVRGKRRSVSVPAKLASDVETAVHRREIANGNNSGTPETQAKAHKGALVQLHDNGVIDREQFEWSDQIAAAAEAVLSDVKIKVASLEARVDSSRRDGAQILEGLTEARHAVAYRSWLAVIPEPKRAVLDMLTGDQIGYTVAAKRYRMDHRRAKRMLLAALDLWPACLDDAARLVTRETLAAAHEALAD